jgi:hypothetical protein
MAGDGALTAGSNPILRVTLDSNTYRRIVTPERFPKDPKHDQLVTIHEAIARKQISAFLSETTLTIEGIRKDIRAEYFASARPNVEVVEGRNEDEELKIGLTIGPRDSHHPGLHPMMNEAVALAVQLGIRFMKAPRIGMPRPAALTADLFVPEVSDLSQGVRQERFAELSQALERQGLGKAAAQAIGSLIRQRLESEAPWYALLNMAQDETEADKISRALNEWADGDTVAGHFAYENDFLCTEDKGKSGPSVFDEAHRSWLTAIYGIRIGGVSELAIQLAK